MRGLRQRLWRKHHQKIHLHALPLQVAHAADFGLEFAPQYVQGNGIAKLEIKRVAHVFVDRHQRRAGVIGRPPLPGNHFVVIGDVGGVGNPAVAAHHPGVFWIDQGRARFLIVDGR